MTRRWMMTLFPVACLLYGAAGSTLPAQTVPASPIAPSPSVAQGKAGKPGSQPKLSPELRAALAAAADLRATARGTKGEARAAILRSVARTYDKVAADFATEPRGVARASYAAGEVWRSLDDLDRARACFLRADQLDKARYHARATMELAHLARREKNIGVAMKLYGEVAELERGTARGLQARLWIARSLAALGDGGKAILAYRQALADAASPRQKIDVCNRLANHLLGMGDLKGAEAVIQEAAAAARTPGVGSAESRDRALRAQDKAYETMSARRALQRAQDKVQDARRDADALQRSRGKARAGRRSNAA